MQIQLINPKDKPTAKVKTPVYFNPDLSSLDGSIKYRLNGKISGECAWELDDTPTVTVSLPRILGTLSVEMVIFRENGEFIKEHKLLWTDIISSDDIYEAKLSLKNLGIGLYFYNIRILTQHGYIYSVKNNSILSFSKDEPPFQHQFSISRFDEGQLSPYTDGIIYHIFVDRFARGDSVKVKENAILVDKWDVIPEYPEYPGAHLKNNTFYGGSLRGIINKLDYIRSLGTSLIYLSPIFESPSNHKYDTADYMKIDEAFGDEKDLSELISEAKTRGIGIILDGVFNHTGADSIYFNKFCNYGSGGAYNDKASEYYSWYDFKSYPDDYTCWWGVEILPRINPDVPKCREFFTGTGGVVEKYARLGIAGFRLDVADELSDSFVKDIRSTLKKNARGTLLYGEVWEDASNKIAYGKRKKYYLGDELDGVMNYPLRNGLISYIRDGSLDALNYALTDIINNAPARIRNKQMNLLGTHDTERIITAIAHESPDGKNNSELAIMRLSDTKRKIGVELLKSLYTIICALPGIPTVFYGDEVGLEGYSDPFNRMPYPYGKEDLDLLEHYKTLGNFRINTGILHDGDFKLNKLDRNLLVFTRRKRTKSIVTVYNNSFKEIKVNPDSTTRCLINGRGGNHFVIKAKECKIYATSEENITIFKI